MPKVKNIKRKRSNVKDSRKPKPISISGHNLWNKSGHLITSRPYGSNGRLIVLFATAFLLLMVLMSFGAVITVPANPAVWATLVFFGGLLILLLANEENIFPVLPKEKKIWAICAWFIAFMVSPYLILNVSAFNFPLFVILIIFLVLLTPIVVRIVLPESQWSSFKSNVKSKTKLNKGKKNKTDSKSKNKLSGVNRNRKIYRK
jgi:hypothetical protein